MRAVVQRVRHAQVTVNGQVIGSIQCGLLVLVGVAHDDTVEDADWLAGRIAELRVFEDTAGKMNLGLRDVNGRVLAVSQFTLLADCRKGRRPSFVHAAPPELARPLFDRFVASIRDRGIAVETGEFGSHMEVELVNDGPVTLVMDRTDRLVRTDRANLT